MGSVVYLDTASTTKVEKSVIADEIVKRVVEQIN